MLRRHGIEEDVEGRDLPVANDDHIHARIVGRLATWTRAPSQATGIVERLRFAVRRVDEVRVRRAKICGEFVECVAPDELARRRVEHAVFGIEFFDGRATTPCVAFAENLLKVAMKQLMDPVIQNFSPLISICVICGSCTADKEVEPQISQIS